MCVHVHVRVPYVCRLEVSVSGVFLNDFPPNFFFFLVGEDYVSLKDLGRTQDLGRLSGQKTRGTFVSISPALELQTYAIIVDCLHGF